MIYVAMFFFQKTQPKKIFPHKFSLQSLPSRQKKQQLQNFKLYQSHNAAITAAMQVIIIIIIITIQRYNAVAVLGTFTHTTPEDEML